MKPLSISIASAAILAAASWGVQAQEKPPQDNAPGASKAAPNTPGGADKGAMPAEKMGKPSGEKPAGREAQMPAAEKPGADKPAAGAAEKPAGRADAGDKAEKPGDKAGQQGAAQKPGEGANKDAAKAEKAGDANKDAAKTEKTGDANKDAAKTEKSDSDNKSADKAGADKAGGDKPAKQAHKDIKPEQKTVIKQTIVKENVRPQKIDVQVHIGVAVPRTVVLHPLPPTIIEIYPAYQPYKFIMVDDNTILVIDPTDWTIVDVIEV